MSMNNRFWRGLWERTVGMRIALWLDKRYPNWCWAHLCTDIGLGWNILGFRRAKEEGLGCKKDCERDRACWCGKMNKGEFPK